MNLNLQAVFEQMHQNLERLDTLPVSMNGGSTLLNVALALVMFGVALGIKPAAFVDIAKNPKSIITGIVCQLVLLPALTLVLIMLCGPILTPMVALGMILVASCPGGNVSNFITSLSKGNSELSVSLTAFNTAACVFTTPINFAFWGKLYLNFAEKHNVMLPELQIPFWDIFQSIVIIMGIPLVLGMLCGQFLPKITKVLKKPLQYLSIVVFVAMVVIIFAGNFDTFKKCILSIFFIVLIHNLLALGIGFGSATVLKLPYKDRRTLTIETGIQNSGLGLILLMNPNIFPITEYIIDPATGEQIANFWFHKGGMLVITAWWGVWHIISGLTLAYSWKVNGRKVVEQD